VSRDLGHDAPHEPPRLLVLAPRAAAALGAVCGLRSVVCGLRSAVCGLWSVVCGLRCASWPRVLLIGGARYVSPIDLAPVTDRG
jgi:hypothetical protein